MRLVYGEYMYSVESGKADKATFFLSREECERKLAILHLAPTCLLHTLFSFVSRYIA
jgi:hypothetical protein